MILTFTEEITFDLRPFDLQYHMFSVPRYPLLDKKGNDTNLIKTWFSDKTQTKQNIVKSKNLVVQKI